jgi:hypothetical protein
LSFLSSEIERGIKGKGNLVRGKDEKRWFKIDRNHLFFFTSRANQKVQK